MMKASPFGVNVTVNVVSPPDPLRENRPCRRTTSARRPERDRSVAKRALFITLIWGAVPRRASPAGHDRAVSVAAARLSTLPHPPRLEMAIFSSTFASTHPVPHVVTVAGSTVIGRIRKRNEDALSLVPEQGIGVVADGMGGHPGGDVASRLAADAAARVLREAFVRRGDGEGFDTCFLEAMEQVTRAAHEDIHARGRMEPTLRGMGTTLTAMILDAETGGWVIGHVGDSRAYRFRDGGLEQLTRDDTWIQQQIDDNVLQPEHARRTR